VKLLSRSLEHLGRGAAAEHRNGRVARDEANQEEDDHAHTDQNREDLHHSA
jgi:hypothetical protein